MQYLLDQLETIVPTSVTGTVVRTEGMAVAVADFPAPVGALAEIHLDQVRSVKADVVGFRDNLTLLYPYDSLLGVRRGHRVSMRRSSRFLRIGDSLLGRVVNARGKPIDRREHPVLSQRIQVDRPPPLSVDRPRIREILATGVRVIDGLLPCGRGQRMGIFAGSGVGKSVLLGMMSRYTAADVSVIALVGERGREVNEFIERDLGPDGLATSVVVVATSDESPLMRIKAAFTATAIAEYFRDRGKHVLLVMDSLTRFAMAQREIGLSVGEPPTTRGYPPSVFTLMPRLVERAGRTSNGSITGFYSVLVEGDDPQEPISDSVRGLLDGHVWLSRELAARGHYPAVDVLESVSRLAHQVAAAEHQQAIVVVRRLLSALRSHEDLISIGAYRRGTNREVDAAMDMRARLDEFLRQNIENGCELEHTRKTLLQLLGEIRTKIPQSESNPPN